MLDINAPSQKVGLPEACEQGDIKTLWRARYKCRKCHKNCLGSDLKNHMMKIKPRFWRAGLRRGRDGGQQLYLTFQPHHWTAKFCNNNNSISTF